MHLKFIFDFQYEAFHGVVPSGIEMRQSPFFADEEKPFIFISYSHIDRSEILEIIKELYESGWKIWYDEGLTIGDRYDETLEAHIKECSAFLLFVTENSINSEYIKENEIPWAVKYCKPIINCLINCENTYEINDGSVIASVSPSNIEQALEKCVGLTKGEKRIAKGISVVVNPINRVTSHGEKFAYCLYSRNHEAIARAIMLEAKNNGSRLYNAVESGSDDQKLQSSACLIVFIDKEFISNAELSGVLIEAFSDGKDIAVCQLEEIEGFDLPKELLGLYKMQWLNYTYGITADMNAKLARHLQKRGCRDEAIIPGLTYEIKDNGISVTRYIGMEPNLRIEREYGGIPVIEISREAFKGQIQLKSIVIPDSVRIINVGAFEG